MALTFEVSNTTTQKLPAGEYVMSLKSVEEAEPSTFDPNTKRLKFIFTVKSVLEIDAYPESAYPDDIDMDDDEAVEAAEDAFNQTLIGKDHWEWTNFKMGPNATLRKWLTGMLGRTIEKGDKISADEFIGKDFKVQLGMENYVIQSTGQAGEKFTIKSIKPYKPARQRNRKQEQENLAPWERDDE